MAMFHPGMTQCCSFCGRDLWEVNRYVTGSATICDACVEIARSVLAEGEGSGERRVFFPPRVFGDEPYEGAADEVVRAYRAVFGGPHTDDAIRRRHLEAADEVGPLMAEAGQRFGQMSTGVRIDRVRFAAADRADVRFTVLLRGGQGPSFEGRAIRRGDTWIVTRDTVLSILPPGSGGAHAVLLTGPPGQHAANT